MGNIHDKHGFVAEAKVTILGHKIIDHMPDQPLYLIKVNGEDRVGRATLKLETDDDITAELYCTAKAWYGSAAIPGAAESFEAAVKRLF